MKFLMGWDAITMLRRPEGASLYELSDKLNISVRYAHEVLNNVECYFALYEKKGDREYPKRKRYYISSIDESGSSLRGRGDDYL